MSTPHQSSAKSLYRRLNKVFFVSYHFDSFNDRFSRALFQVLLFLRIFLLFCVLEREVNKMDPPLSEGCFFVVASLTCHFLYIFYHDLENYVSRVGGKRLVHIVLKYILIDRSKNRCPQIASVRAMWEVKLQNVRRRPNIYYSPWTSSRRDHLPSGCRPTASHQCLCRGGGFNPMGLSTYPLIIHVLDRLAGHFVEQLAPVHIFSGNV